MLVVEDDAAVRRSLQLLLRSRGMDVRAYASSRSALADLDSAPADCLITDLVMPDVDGVALLRAMREQGWSGPAILISGHLDPKTTARAEQAGFQAIMQKPVRDSVIVEAIEALLDRRVRNAEPVASGSIR